MRNPTNDEWKTLPLIELISPEPWNMKISTGRRQQKERKMSSEKSMRWQNEMGNIPADIMRKTLENISQLVDTIEADTRLIPRRHLMSRLPMFQVKRIRDGFFSDPFFAASKYIRGYNTCQLFYGAESKCCFVNHAKGKGYAPHSLHNFIRSIGPPSMYPQIMHLEKRRGNGNRYVDSTASSSGQAKQKTRIRTEQNEKFKMQRGKQT